MPLAIAVKVSPTYGSDARLDATTRVLLHCDGHYQLLERSLCDFLHLERQLRAEINAAAASPLSTSIAHSINALCNANQSMFSINQRSIRLSVAIETFLDHVVRRSALLATSRALKLFVGGNEWTSDETSARRYHDAAETAIRATGREELVHLRVAAGCCVEHHEAVECAEAETKRVVLWKFASEGAGVMFRAEFSRTVATESPAMDPYSIGSNDVVEPELDERDVAYYRTQCTFEADDPSFVYGHFVAETTGVLTLHWENVDKSSVLSKSLRFGVAVVPLCAAHDVLEAADACNTVDSAEWLLSYIRASNVTCIEDLTEWNDDECEDSAFGEDSAHDSSVKSGDANLKSRLESAVLEERNHKLEAQVTRLEKRLAATKDKLKSAVDRAQIAEEIYKANLETIAQLERAAISGSEPKSQKGAALSPAMPFDKPRANVGMPMEQAVSSELERVQNLCAGFQEQCLWRSVENMELEAHLAASQVEASSWQARHGAQAVQIKELEQQVATLRTHKKMLVHEVKRLQPFSHVNVAALVQEAQEARMVQRSLQATLAAHERVSTTSVAKVLPSTGEAAEMDDQAAE